MEHPHPRIQQLQKGINCRLSEMDEPQKHMLSARIQTLKVSFCMIPSMIFWKGTTLGQRSAVT